MIVQSDSSETLATLSREGLSRSTYGRLVSEIKHLMAMGDFIPMKLKRDQNRMADRLASYSCTEQKWMKTKGDDEERGALVDTGHGLPPASARRFQQKCPKIPRILPCEINKAFPLCFPVATNRGSRWMRLPKTARPMRFRRGARFYYITNLHRQVASLVISASASPD